MSTFRAVVDAVLDDLQTNVTGLGTEVLEDRVFRSAQFVYPADAPSLASWFEQEEQEDEGPTGARHYRELYGLRYWEPAPFDDVTMRIDDDAGLVLEDLYEEVRGRFMRVDAQSLGLSSPLWVLRGKLHKAAEVPEDGSEAAFTQGFEIHYWSRRFREFAT
jgi:hypothetical protein